MKINTFIKNTQNEWKNILPSIKQNALKILDDEFIEIDFSKNEIENIPMDFGVYLIKIYPMKQFDFIGFKKEWKSDKSIIKTPNISSSRIHFDGKEKWYPFYIGKSEKLSKRINEHCFQDRDKTTYGLKLKNRNSLLENAKFGFSYYRVTQDKTLDKNVIQFVMTNLEREIRNEINPWVGKQ